MDVFTIDVFPGMNVGAIKVAIWVIAIIVGLAVLARGVIKAKTKRQYAWSVVKAIFGGSLTFAVMSLVAMLYIVSHPIDLRWSEGKKPMIEFNDIGQNTFFQDFAAPLNDVKDTAVDAANKAIAIENTFATLPEFLAMTLFSAAIAVMFALPMLAYYSIQKRLMFVQYRATKSKLESTQALVVVQHGAIQDLQRKNGVADKDVLPDIDKETLA